MKETLRTLLKDLVTIDGVSGFESQVAAYICSHLSSTAHHLDVDSMGNVIARFVADDTSLDSSRLKVMFCAHMDEVGFIVKGIEPDGFLRFDKIGVIPDEFLPGLPVRIKGIKGAVGTRPGYLMNRGDKRIDARELYIDIGLSSRDEVLSLGINIGDPVSYYSDFVESGSSSRIMAKAVDDRAGCAVLLAFAQMLSRFFASKRFPIPLEVLLVFTTQEEVGCRGAKVAAQRLRPDYAFVVDTMPAGDTPDTSLTKDINAALGKGIVVPVMSGGISIGEIMAERVRNLIFKAATAQNLPFQLAVLPVAATDSSAIRTAGEGIPVGTLGIPRRYAHSPVEIVDLIDLETATKFCMSLLEELVKRSDIS